MKTTWLYTLFILTFAGVVCGTVYYQMREVNMTNMIHQKREPTRRVDPAKIKYDW